jgi:hypothetical protein
MEKGQNEMKKMKVCEKKNDFVIFNRYGGGGIVDGVVRCGYLPPHR